MSLDTVIVAPYPRSAQAHGEQSTGGVASYTKNLVDQLRHHVRVRILAPGDAAAGERRDGDVVVRDVPRHGRHLARALHALSRDGDVGVVHVQFEQHLFGGVKQNLRLLAALRKLRRSKRVVVTIHQVPDLDAVDRRFLRENAFPAIPPLARAWLRLQYALLARCADLVVVHEGVLLERLARQYAIARRRLLVIPHGIEVHEPEAQAGAKAKLGVPASMPTALYFGYVTGYKGVDLLVDALEGVPPDQRAGLRVVIAGKAPDRKLAHKGFRENIEGLEARIRALSPFVERKGFLSHDDIALHLAAADVVIFPYRHFFAASGPLSIALGHARPVLATDAFRGMLHEDALFARSPEALREKLRAFVADASLRARLQSQARALRDASSWPRVAERTAACYASLAGGAP